MASGPQLPKHLTKRNITPQAHNPNTDSGGDDGAYGPALPPHLAAKKKTERPTRRSPSPIALYKTAPSKHSEPPVQEDSDSDEFGPPPPTAGPSTTSNEDAVREFKEREQRRKELAEVSYLSKCVLYSPWQSFSQSQKCSRFSQAILHYYPPCTVGSQKTCSP